MEVVIVKGEGAVLGVNMGRPIVTNGAFATRSSQITLRTCCVCVCVCDCGATLACTIHVLLQLLQPLHGSLALSGDYPDDLVSER